MPVFIFLVFVLAAVLWVLLSFVFRPLGRLVGRVWKDAKDAMDEEDSSEDDTANKKLMEVKNTMRKKGFIGAIVLAVLIFGGIILALLCTSRVPAG